MDAILTKFTEYGLSGLIIVVLCYDVFYLQRKFVSIIEANTRALQKLTDLIEKKV